MPDSHLHSSQRRWPKLQFTLRMLLVLTAVLAVWLNVQLISARRQRAAVKAIQEYGGSVRYDFEPDDPKLRHPPLEPKWLVDLVGVDFLHDVEMVNLLWQFTADKRVNNPHQNPEILDHLKDLPGLKSLWLQGSQATDESMHAVARADNLEKLHVFTHRYMRDGKARESRPRVSHKGIAALRPLDRLRVLSIDNAPLDDRALETISQFQQLEELTLQGPGNAFGDTGLLALQRLNRLRILRFGTGYGSTNFSDEGLSALTGLQRLEELWLRGERISDEGLERLAALSKLNKLVLASKLVTPEAMSRFQQTMPGTTCQFYPCDSFTEDMRKIVASLLRIKRREVAPASTLSELGLNDRKRRQLIGFLRDDYFQFDPDDAENLRSFLAEVEAGGDLTVQQLADLVHRHVGK